MKGPIKLTITQGVDPRRQISLSQEAERIISDLQPRSVDVVAVVGPMRKGKSHFANLLCDRKSGFPLGDEMEPKTKDFWFWIGPHPIQTDRYLMVVDTEGLGDYSDKDPTDKDLKHLVLATLLSNHLVFNLQGNPDSDFVSNLSLMGDLAERIRVQKDGKDEGSNFGDHFPELWVVLQDVHLKLPERDGRRLEPDEYFSEVLLGQKDGQSKSIRSHNATKAFFPKRHLRLIPAPSIDPEILSKLDKVEENDVQKKYTDAVGKFTGEIWNSGQVKRVNGDDIKTTGLLHILRYYVNAINDPNSIPSVLGAYEAMAEGECRRVSDECMKQFKKTVEETVEQLMPMDEETCNRNIKTAAESAVFKLCADVGKWDKDGKWKEDLEEKLEAERLGLLEVNRSKSKGECEKIMGEADESVRHKVESGYYTKFGGFDMYVKEMNGVFRAYEQEASGKGPAVEKVMETFSATETTRRNTIKHAAIKAEEDESRVKAERKKRQEAEEAKKRAAEDTRKAKAEAERERKAAARADERLEKLKQSGTNGADVAVAGFKALGQGLHAVGEVGKGVGYAVGETAKCVGCVALAIASMPNKLNKP